jgi:hypothetical protein
MCQQGEVIRAGGGEGWQQGPNNRQSTLPAISIKCPPIMHLKQVQKEKGAEQGTKSPSALPGISCCPARL